MMDQSVTRRDQPCWYRVEGVGLTATNDAFMLEASIYFLLKKHFRTEPYYVRLLELFHEVSGSLQIHVYMQTERPDNVQDGNRTAPRSDHCPRGRGGPDQVLARQVRPSSHTAHVCTLTPYPTGTGRS